MISKKGDKCFAFPALHTFGVFHLLVSQLQALVLDFGLTVFGVLVGDSLIPLLIIVKLFFWFRRP